MKAKYVKEHNNYDLTLGKEYEVQWFKKGWLVIKSDDKGNRVLYREECFEREEYSTEEAAAYALRFCEKYPEWKRICDIENHEELYQTWEELSEKERKPWIDEYGVIGAKEAWNELGNAHCKVQYGFISGKGKFYKRVRDVPHFHSLMQIYRIG